MEISTFQKITQPPQAPPTPVIAQQAIEELIDYYRELAHFHRLSVEYHQKIAQQHTREVEAAQKQLADIEALLNPLTHNSDRYYDNTNGSSSNGTARSIEVDSSEAKSVMTVVESAESRSEKQTTKKPVNSQKSQLAKSQTVIKDSNQNNGSTKNSQTESIKNHKPLGKQNTSKTKKNHKSFSSRLPLSEKLAHYETIVDAVAVCLQEFYPRVVSVKNILQYYYPDGLDELAKKKAYASFSDCLSKGAGKQGWVKISKGNYRWKDESKNS